MGKLVSGLAKAKESIPPVLDLVLDKEIENNIFQG
jgi:hypothetical protein